MTSRPALAALIGAMDVPPGEAMNLLVDYRAEVAHELAERIRRELNAPHGQDTAANAADLIDPVKEGQ